MSARFDLIAREFFDSLCSLDPSRATELGLTSDDHRLPDGGPGLDQERVRIFERASMALAALPESELDADQRLDIELIANEAALQRFHLESGTWIASGRDPAMDLTGALDALFCRQSRPPVHRVEALTARMAAAPAFLEQARERFRRPVRFWVQEARHSCVSGRAFLDEIVDAVPGLVEGHVSGAEAAQLAGAARAAADQAKQALTGLETWLHDEVRPRAVKELALGEDATRELLGLRRLGYSVEELEDLGREAYAAFEDEYRREVEALHPELGFHLAERRWMDAAPRPFEKVLELYREAVTSSREFVTSKLGLRVPGEERLEVRPTPAYLCSVIPSAAYFEPERFGEGPDHGIYMVTPPAGPDDFSEHAPGMVYNTSTHEGYPGHHLQLCWAKHNPSLLRAWVGGDEFCEGWAHYCEELCYDEGFRPVPGTRAAQVKDALFRALRIRVDLGLMTGGLTLDQAVHLLVDEGHIPERRAEGEVTWYTQQPGYPLGYLVGKVMLKELRAEEERRGHFDAPRFHHDVLAGGTMPVWAHRRRLELLRAERRE